MIRACKYRIYPTKRQESILENHFGACRFIYNLALETKSLAYLGARVNVNKYEISKQLTELKKDVPWLREINTQSLQASLENLDRAFVSFFKGNADYPKYKSKKNKQSYQCKQGIKMTDRLYLPRFVEGIKVVIDRTFIGDIKGATIIKTSTGKYYATLTVNDKKQITTPNSVIDGKCIGVDLGVKSFCVLSDGSKVEHPNYYKKSLGRLRVLQVRLNKKVRGSNNRRKAALKVAAIHEKIASQKTDFLHKLSTKLVRDNQTLCFEDLNIQGMMKFGGLSQSVFNSGWGAFVRMIEYKCSWQGKNFIKIGKFDPSTKTCSACNTKNQTLSLNDREWVCANCGAYHDRDVNAAINIRNFAIKKSRLDKSGAPVEMSAIAESEKQEVNTTNKSSDT